MLQKMRRYVKAFSREEENEKEGMEKTDTMTGSISGTPKLRPKHRGGFNNRKSLTGWQMIRHSTLGLEMEKEDSDEDQDIKYV